MDERVGERKLYFVQVLLPFGRNCCWERMPDDVTNWLPEKRMSDKLLLLLCCLEDKTSTCMWSVPEAP